MAIRAVIFDLFGTLLTLRQKRRHFYELAAELGVRDLRALRDRAMATDRAGVFRLFAELGLADVGRLEACEAAIAEDAASAALYDDSLGTMRALRRAGLRVGVLSNLSVFYRRPFFELGLDREVDAAVLSCDEGLIKPMPGVYHRMLDRLGVAAREALMVGDTLVDDVEAPRSLGLEALWLRRGLVVGASLAHPELVITGLGEVLGRLQLRG